MSDNPDLIYLNTEPDAKETASTEDKEGRKEACPGHFIRRVRLVVVNHSWVE
jgi:hypothetical protein